MRLIHHIKRGLGAGFCQYEEIALLVDDDTLVPKWTWCCHPRDDAPTAENRVRLALALASVAWVAVHLLRPWAQLAWRWLRHDR